MIERLERAAILTLIFFLPISTALIEISTGVILVCFVFKIISAGSETRAGFFKRPLTKSCYLPLALFFVVMGFSVLSTHVSLTISLTAWILKWGKWLLLFVALRSAVKKEDLRLYLTAFLFSCCLLTVDGLWQKITGMDFLRHYSLEKTNDFSAVRASFHHYNNFGSYLAAAFLLCFGTLFEASARRFRFLIAVLMLLILINLVFTYSRGSWAVLLVSGVGIYFLYGSSRERLFMAILSCVLIAALLAIPDVRERLFFIVTSGGDEQRVKVWSAAWKMFLNHPWTGNGAGSFMKLFPSYAAQAGLSPEFYHQYAHNCYLQIMVENGAAAFFLFAWFLVNVFRKAFLCARQMEPVFLGLLAAGTAVALHAVIDVHFYSVQLAALFWILLGFLSTISEREADIPIHKMKGKGSV